MNLVRLCAADLDPYLGFRHEGLRRDADAFRFAPEDDEVLGREAWRARLERDVVLGARNKGALVGVGGFSRLSGAKIDHKGLIWGMVVSPDWRARGVADAIMAGLIDHARTCVRQVQLTVMADNPRACAFYERHGFVAYGVERDAVRREDGFADEMLMWRMV